MKKIFRRVLVIGANGMLGYGTSEYFKKNNYQVTELIRKDFDIAKEQISKIASKVKNSDVVINCAGVIKPRISSNSIEAVLKINGVFPWNLARLCSNYDIPCFHITTDCVFSGKRGNYSEKDYIDAEDLYGLSKAAGDTPLCMTLRTSIIGEEKKNKRSLLEWVRAQKGKTVNGYMNHKWNGLTTPYLAEIIENIIDKHLFQKGIFHIYSPRVISKYSLLQMIGKIYDLNLTVKKASAQQSSDRSLKSVYSLSSKLVKKNIKTQLKEMREYFKSDK